MKKLALLIVCLFCFASTSLAAPAAPQMSYSLNGTNITVDWSNVPDATGYTLYYAAYPYAPGDYIGSLDRGNNKSYSINLWDGAAYYIATSARNAQGNSGYSNIEYFIMKDHELVWEDRATLGSARTQFAGGVIDDMIYSFGGYNENGLLLSSLEIYDPSTDSWTFGTANTKSVADLSGAVVSKKLYVFGATGDNCGTTPFAEKYDPNTEQWSALASKTTQTSGSPAVSYNGKVYLFGGWQLNSCNDTSKVLKKNVEAYDPLTNRWQTVTTMPKALEGATVAVYEDKAYVIGGVDGQGNYATDIIAYDFIADSWTESGLGSLNTPRMFPANSSAPVIEDTIVLVGGWVDSSARSDNANRVESNSVEIYSSRTRSVAIGNPLPEATAGHLPAVIGGELFIIGGMANERATDKSWKADISIENEIRGIDLESDIDDDGFPLSEDCNDNNYSINPSAIDICEDGIDQDCSGSDEVCAADPLDVDDDNDGYTENQGDCNDAAANIYPTATESCGDGIDQDCSGSDEICPIYNLSWTTASPLLEKRDQFAGGVIGEKIYVFGGNRYPDGDNLNTTEIYDLNTDTWTNGESNYFNSDYGYGVEELSGVVYQESLFTIGAWGGPCGTLNFVQEYSSATNQWFTRADKPTPVSAAPSVLHDGEIFVFGGGSENSCASGEFTPTNVVEAYKPSTNTWRSVTVLPMVMEGMSVAVIGDYAYLVGGIDNSGNPSLNVMAYSFSSNTWTTSGLGSLSRSRYLPYTSAAPVVNGQILLIGGYTRSDEGDGVLTEGNSIVTNLVEVYNPTTNTIVELNPLPVPNASHLSVVVGNSLYVIGGKTGMLDTDITGNVWVGDF